MHAERFAELIRLPERNAVALPRHDDEPLFAADEAGGEELQPLHPWRLLVVDDDPEVHQVTRLVLAGLTFAGRPVRLLHAHSAAEARAQLCDHWETAVVLLDVVMESDDAGLTLVRYIREELQNRLVRIVLRTGQAGHAPERRVVVEYDIDDYREKSELTATQLFTSVVAALRAYRTIVELEEARRGLEAQVAERTRELSRALDELQQAHRELARHRDQLQREQALAKQVLAKVAETSGLDTPDLKYLLSPMDVANGDILLAAPRPGGGRYLLFGDFTGHGLTAALGALPAADLFHRLTARGLPIEIIVARINDALKAKLPTGLFLVACMVESVPQMGRVKVWNGGAPDLYLYGHAGVKARIPSGDLPLGIVANTALALTVHTFEIEAGDRLLIYSDGVIEAENGNGERFGDGRLERCLNGAPETLFERLHQALFHFLGEAPRSDDITLAELAVGG